MKQKLMSLITFCILVSLNSNAQGTFSIHAGPSFPLADFGDDDIYDDDSGLAAVGITLGGNYLYKLNNKGLGLNIGLNFKFNGLKSRAKDDVEEIIELAVLQMKSHGHLVKMLILNSINTSTFQ